VTFQARFLSFDQATGTVFSGLIPSPSTPRQHAQSAAETAKAQHIDDKTRAWRERKVFMEEGATLLDAEFTLNLRVQSL
jgi:hypothetical protein